MKVNPFHRLLQIPAQEVEKRIQKVRTLLSDCEKELSQNFEDELEQFNVRKKNKYASYQESISDNIESFTKAANNISCVLFPMMRQELMVMTLSESQFPRITQNVKIVLQKSWQHTVRRLMRQEDGFNCDSNEDSQWSLGKTKRIQKVKVESRTKGKNCKIPMNTSHVLQKWLIENFREPYPSKNDKKDLSSKSGLNLKQVNNWFINARERVVKKFIIRPANKFSKGRKVRKEESKEGSNERRLIDQS